MSDRTNKLVYLAGPITGCSHEGCTSWRQYAVKKLKEWGIHGLSPMRQKDYLIGIKVIADSYSEHVMSTAKGITSRDRWDATRCSVLLANFSGAKTVSIGTCMEIAWADISRIPIVVVMEKDNIHQHGMLKDVAGFEVETLDAGLDVVKNLLGDWE